MTGDDVRLVQAIGRAAFDLWADLPRNIQEQIFEQAAGVDEVLRHELAVYLHDRHPRTAHPAKPTALA
jgi:hypothetical protein